MTRQVENDWSEEDLVENIQALYQEKASTLKIEKNQFGPPEEEESEEGESEQEGSEEGSSEGETESE